LCSILSRVGSTPVAVTPHLALLYVSHHPQFFVSVNSCCGNAAADSNNNLTACRDVLHLIVWYLRRFKRDSGTLVDPAVQQACQEAFDEGEQLFKDKLVAAALSKYAVAAELMPLRTELGGRSRLQKAICLDSLGQNKEAFAVYGLIERHPNADVAKVAKRMIFGFRAMDNLKAHTISYSVTKGAYDKYFNTLSGDWNAAYVSNDEDSTELTKAILLASAVMLLPLVFLALKIWF